MIEFTLWDILRNLLLATRWTILLSLVSFIGGGVVGLGCCSCVSASARHSGQSRNIISSSSRARRC